MIKEHEHFHWRDSGLVIKPKYPFLGASPDGIGPCDCCGEVLVKIKCPYCHRDSKIDEAVECLEKRDGQLSLKKSHSYFYQIQCQLLLSNKEYCDFLKWTKEDFFTERIIFEEEFCVEIVEKSKQFFKSVVLPELIGKLYSRPLQGSEQTQNGDTTVSNTSSADVICTCRTVYKESDSVIGCDNENCA